MTLPPRLELYAPLNGKTTPLAKVPDRVFAQKIVGNGIAIEPESELLLSPCDAKVILLHPCHHSITLRSEQGVELLLHIGLDTVTLKGEGFTPLVKPGEQVQMGTPLIQFDAKSIEQSVRSLTTLLLVTNGEKISRYEFFQGEVKAAQDKLISLTLNLGQGVSNGNTRSSYVQSPLLTVLNPLGFHARPAAILVHEAKKYVAEIELHHNGKTVDAKSLMEILALNIQRHDEISFRALGQDAAYAVQSLQSCVQSGLGEPLPDEDKPDDLEPPLLVPPEAEEDIFVGISASPGVAIGPVFQWQTTELSFPLVEYAEDSKKQKETFNQAIADSQSYLRDFIHQLKEDGKTDSAAIFSAHLELLDDPAIIRPAREHIAQGKVATYAWYDAIQQQLKRLTSTENPLLMARASDLQELCQMVLKRLLGVPDILSQIPKDCILIAESLSPSDTAHLGHHSISGIVTVQGSATSHAALLARSMGIPTLTAAPLSVQKIENGQLAVLDGCKGTLCVRVSEGKLEQFKTLQEKRAERRQQALANATKPAITTDGHRFSVVANIGNAFDAIKAIRHGAEGVGLLRSEFLYMEQYEEPSEEQQAQVYLEIADVLGTQKPLIIRTLDAGGDKPLHYLPHRPERNPVLGERGIRISLSHPAMLRRQVRAILRAYHHCQLKIMFPMIATLPELRAAKRIVNEEAAKYSVSGLEIGIMVEVPSAAILASQFAQEVDFFSIGTNDLTQYTLAMDRANPALSWQVDALDPAILHLIKMTVDGAKTHGKWVGLCGSAASDPLAIPILLGLGVNELSCSIPLIHIIKEKIRTLSLFECQQIAQQALTQTDAASVRALLRKNQSQEAL